MQWLDQTLPTVAENLALDEALLLAAEAGTGTEVLRVWEWPHPAVILGAGCRVAQEVDQDACYRAAVPILRRSSGGGTVLLGQGCLCYSLVLSYERSPALREIQSSYRFILERLRQAIATPWLGIGPAGTSDLAWNQLKFSGNSQQRKRYYLLHHGTLLHGFDLRPVGRFLRMPARQPAYRQGRPHLNFLVNLPVSAEEIKQQLRRAWQAEEENRSWPEQEVRQLVRDKYSRPEWIRRR